MRRIVVYLAAVLAIIAGSTLIARPSAAQSTMDPTHWFTPGNAGQVDVDLYFFWSETCPHCLDAHPVIDDLPDRFPWLTLHSHEVSGSQENARLYSEMAAAAGEEAMYVPAFIFCGHMVTGWDAEETTGAAIIDSLEQCHAWGMDNYEMLAASVRAADHSGDNSGKPTDGTSATHDAAVAGEEAEEKAITEAETTDEDESAKAALLTDSSSDVAAMSLASLEMDPAAAAAPALALPLIGQLNVEALSLPALTVVIAGLDAFNPCAFFVLMFLLSLMVHAQDRKRMLLIGVTFVFFSGLIYFVFMAAWLNLFLFVGELKLITMIAGLIAIVIALFNIKDFFWFKKGASLSIPDRAKPGLYQRSRNLLKASSLAAILAGTAILAVAANSYELLCTSGFPMVYTRMLTLNDLPTTIFYLYLAAYNAIYIIPLLFIVVLFTVRFGQHKLTETEGRVLKLLSGLMMFFLGLLLVLAPDALNQVATAVLLLVVTIVITAIIVFIDRRRHPGDYGSSQPA